MHITALCPFCRSAYQVQATLRGQLVRCPNAACRKVFPVPSEEPEPPGPSASSAHTPPRPSPQSGSSQRSGSVGDMVPILPTESAASPPESGAVSPQGSDIYPLAPEQGGRAAAEVDWRQAAPPVRSRAGTESEKQTPPPRKPGAAPSGQPADPSWWYDAPRARATQTPAAPAPARSPTSSPPTQAIRRSARPPAETQPMPALAPATPSELRELPPGVWEPPPVRRGPESQEQAAPPVEEIPADEAPPPRLTKRLAKYAIPAAIVLILGLGAGGFWVAWKALYKSEEDLAKQADGYYEQETFEPARQTFETLVKNFPNSEHHDKYSFMVDWCGVCDKAKNPEADLPDVAAQLDKFIKDHKKDFKKDLQELKLAHDAGQRLLHLVRTFAERYANPTDDTPLAAADRLEQLRGTVISLGHDALKPNESGQIDAEIRKVRVAVEKWRKRRDTLAAIRLRGGENPMDAIKRSVSLLARMERELPGITEAAKPALDELEKIHLESVVFQPAKDVPAPPAPPAEENGDVVLFAPLLPKSSSKNAPPANNSIVLALARGVLYALKAANGELKWATHVGIDTMELPQRVPASAITPELFLVLSADTQTLSALDVNGNSLWEYRVGQPVLGRPLIIDQRAYLADYSGWVHEIELSRGQLLGRWDLGQPLKCGGTREEGTSRVYFPADEKCIYVLDVKARRCVTILYDGHPSGSLRSGPIIVPPERDTPGYLILNQASGLDRMQLRVFELPLQDPHAQPLPLTSRASLAGWTWFEPKEDGEKLAVLSDAGILGLFGIRQFGNNDPPLFPLLRSGEVDLSPFLRPSTSPTKRNDFVRERGRSLVVHMQGNDLWVLAHGRFQQLYLGMTPALGPQAVPRWKEPLELGSPLHEPQRIEERNGQTTFFLVTQALNQQTCLATAVDEEGEIRWQRQLGSVCQGQPLALTPQGGGSPVLVMLDQGGGLFALDPQQPTDKPRAALAGALADNPKVSPRLFPAADGSAYEIAVPGEGHELVIRHIEWGGDDRKLRCGQPRVAPMPTDKTGKSGRPSLVGPPAVTGSVLLMPMTDGKVRWLSLTEERPSLELGPAWRKAETPVVPPTILPLHDTRFLIADGSRQLTVYEWTTDKGVWWELPKTGEPTKPLEYLMAAPPVLLPAPKNQLSRVVVADSAGALRLFTVTPDGALEPGPPWKLTGNLTGGPFVQATPEGWRIGCILDRHRLLWIDPNKTEPLWTYATDGPSFVGQPQLIEDVLVVALQSGRYVGVDPKTGKPRGPGYTLRTSAAPAATPMPFGPGRMFAPLSDGTALLLSMELLKKN